MIIPTQPVYRRAGCIALMFAALQLASIDARAVSPQPPASEGATGLPADTGSSASAALTAPVIEYDLSTLPKPVARLREQLLDAARSGDIEKLRPIIDANEGTPIFSFGGESDPIAFWKEMSGDSQGREILAILMEVLEAGFVHTRQGQDEDLYVWPYFAEIAIADLTPPQEVELYKLVTAQDRKDMEEFGAYNFYRVGIKPDGQWVFFVAGD